MCAFFAAAAPAAAEIIKRSSVIVNMPRLAVLTISGDVSGLLTLSPDGSGETAYEAGSVQSAANATVLTLNVTEAWDLTARLEGGWTCPPGYEKTKQDLMIRIDKTQAGTVQNGADNFVALDTADITILSSDEGCGPSNVDIQTGVLLDWTRDVPGNYSVTVTYTLVGHLP